MNPSSLRDYLQFQLATLKTLNKHHEFEWICYYVAKARLASNLRPATGPVSAGGDQGIDFDTYRIDARRCAFGSDIDAGVLHDERAVFLCTTQESSIKTKIFRDLTKARDFDPSTTRVYVFMSEPLPIGRRNAYEKEAREKHSISLEIFDRVKLADWLTEPDLFWIADEFLNVPASMAPAMPENEADAWYVELRDRLIDGEDDNAPPTHARMMSVCRALRHAWSSDAFKPDVLRWVRYLAAFAEDVPDWVTARADYEILVAFARTRRGWHGQLDRFQRVMSRVTSASNVELADLVCLLGYGSAFAHAGLFDIDEDDLAFACANVVSRIDYFIATCDSDSTRCQMFAVRGQVELYGILSDSLSDSVARATDWWLKLTPLVHDAPFFDVDGFTELLFVVSQSLGEADAYSGLLDSLDLAVEQRAGKAALATRALRRATSELDARQWRRALGHLHRSTRGHIAAGDLRSALGTVILASDVYLHLGYCSAAKLYALGAFSLIANAEDEALKRWLPLSCLFVAESDFLRGDWFYFLEAFTLSYSAFGEFAADPPSPSTARRLDWIMMACVPFVVAISERLDPLRLEVLNERFDWLQTSDALEDAYA